MLLFAGKNVFLKKVHYLWKTLLWNTRGLCLPVYLLMRSLVFGDNFSPLLLLFILILLSMVLFVITGNRCTGMKTNLFNSKKLLKSYLHIHQDKISTSHNQITFLLYNTEGIIDSLVSWIQSVSNSLFYSKMLHSAFSYYTPNKNKLQWDKWHMCWSKCWYTKAD